MNTHRSQIPGQDADAGSRRGSRLTALLKVMVWKWRLMTNLPLYRATPLLAVSRLLAWRIRCWLKLPAVIDLPRCGAKFFLPPRWGGEGSTLIYVAREDAEIELTFLDRLLRPGDVVADAGANFGIYTVIAAKLVGADGRVLAFEPNAGVMPVLRRNVELNGFTNVRLFQEALSDSEGRVQLYHYADLGPVGYAIAPGETGDKGSETVTTVSLDAALQREELTRVDFLKLDIEGAELAALRGAKELFDRCRPVIVFELNPEAAARFGLAADAAWRHLEALDYHFFTLSEAGKLHRAMSPPPEKSWGFQNIIALHADHMERFREML